MPSSSWRPRALSARALTQAGLDLAQLSAQASSAMSSKHLVVTHQIAEIDVQRRDLPLDLAESVTSSFAEQRADELEERAWSAAAPPARR